MEELVEGAVHRRRSVPNGAPAAAACLVCEQDVGVPVAVHVAGSEDPVLVPDAVAVRQAPDGAVTLPDPDAFLVFDVAGSDACGGSTISLPADDDLGRLATGRVKHLRPDRRSRWDELGEARNVTAPNHR